MKKYRLKNPDLKGVVIGNLGKKLVILGNEDTTDVRINNMYLYEMLCAGLRLSDMIQRLVSTPPTFYDNKTILERVKDGWPIELGLVEEIPEEQKRVYMDRYEALRMVYEEGKKVAYDNGFWLHVFEYIFLADDSEALRIKTTHVRLDSALSKTYNQKLWYVLGDK